MNITEEMAEVILTAKYVAEHESQIDIESVKEIAAEIIKVYPKLNSEWLKEIK